MRASESATAICRSFGAGVASLDEKKNVSENSLTTSKGGIVDLVIVGTAAFIAGAVGATGCVWFFKVLPLTGMLQEERGRTAAFNEERIGHEDTMGRLSRREEELLFLWAFYGFACERQDAVRTYLREFESRLPVLSQKVGGETNSPRWQIAFEQYDGILERWKRRNQQDRRSA